MIRKRGFFLTHLIKRNWYCAKRKMAENLRRDSVAGIYIRFVNLLAAQSYCKQRPQTKYVNYCTSNYITAGKKKEQKKEEKKTSKRKIKENRD